MPPKCCDLRVTVPPELPFTGLGILASFLIGLEMPPTADFFLLTRCLQNANMPGDSKNAHSLSIYHELVKSNFRLPKREGLTERERGEGRASDFATLGLGSHERKSILGVQVLAAAEEQSEITGDFRRR